MKKLAVALTLLLLLSFGTTLAQQVAKVDRPMNIPSFVGYVQDEFIVKFKPNAGTMTLRQGPSGSVALGVGDFDAVAAAYSVDGLREQFPGSKTDPNGGEFSRYYVAKFNQGSLEEAMAAFRELPMVELVEPIAIHTVFATPNDGYYVNQWHLNRANDADVDAPEAWDIETGKTNIIVAIMDSGVRYYHKDLGGSAASSTTPTAADGNMWINWAEKNGTAGVDDDGNGYVDDWVGWDWVTGVTGCWSGEDCSTADNDPRDFNGHGTHCAGNVGAGNNNGYATCAPSGGWGNGALQTTGNGVKVMALRIGYSGSYLGQEVGYIRMDFAASAFYYAARNGAKIASCSWGSSNTSGLGVAIDTFLARGGLIFKAAGNDNTQTADYMCSRTDIISVAALDSNGCKADFSTYGTWIDISAPGTGIWSSYHDHANPTADYVAALDGTSMATPLTASVAALIWSKNPTWTAAQVKAQLLAAVDTISGLSCNSAYAGKLGSGRINAYKAVNTGTPCDVAASFVGAPTSGQIPLAVNFTDQSTGPITSWSWNFGDGGTSTAQNPSHTYTTAGTYTVALTVNSATCSNTMTRTNYITATAPTIAMHVSSITVAEEYVSRKYRGRATVTIVDANNNPVSGAVVTGFFNYPNTTPVSATTNTSGVATLYSALNKKTVNFCFEVTNVTKTGYTYNAAANVVTRACETGPVFSQGDLAVAAGNMPTSFELAQNHPNPFNPTTSISFSLPTSSSVTLNVYNVLGEKIRTLATGTYGAGTHTVEWNSTNDQGETVASGIYFYRLTAGTEVLTKKMLLMK